VTARGGCDGRRGGRGAGRQGGVTARRAVELVGAAPLFAVLRELGQDHHAFQLGSRIWMGEPVAG
jgi:hypothetical protein